MAKITPVRMAAWTLLILGLLASTYRFIFGLGAATNLSDNFPWGLWIGLDVMAGVALAAGGFVITFLVYIMNLKRFQPLVRPAVLTAFIGYVLSASGILFDLGQPLRIWHPLVEGNLHSPLFEVALSVMSYLLVLALEFSPNFLGRKTDSKGFHALKSLTIPLVFIGITISTLHQSSLGTLFVIAAGRLHPLWYSAFLPLLFFISAIAAGLGATTLESYLSSRAYDRPFETDALAALAKGSWWVLLIYAVLRLGDLAVAGSIGAIFEGSRQSNMFIVEMLTGVVAPLVLFRLPRVKSSMTGLLWTQVLVVVGVVMNRFDTALVGMAKALRGSYVPSFYEFLVTLGFIALGVLLYAWAVENLPVFEATPVEAALREAAAAREPEAN